MSHGGHKVDRKRSYKAKRESRDAQRLNLVPKYLNLSKARYSLGPERRVQEVGDSIGVENQIWEQILQHHFPADQGESERVWKHITKVQIQPAIDGKLNQWLTGPSQAWEQSI